MSLAIYLYISNTKLEIMTNKLTNLLRTFSLMLILIIFVSACKESSSKPTFSLKQTDCKKTGEDYCYEYEYEEGKGIENCFESEEECISKSKLSRRDFQSVSEKCTVQVGESTNWCFTDSAGTPWCSNVKELCINQALLSK